ncbi:SDR family oxidoreductase [Staphylococcus pseudintermedius]|uniref:SDR family oxidoreductase n=1 Tax=Staphylococcus pseudintermedius TaxID=283734 RepID=UPI000D72ABAD|nr:SDR family oxidoreductase [Staphylococcus pseudintermedius]EGQ3409288.1 SDR family oxidoreductase [Staphylococcus pseudintermedius]EGQ3539126.1 SDR family oxidoreductase [Staphylococcus pseudintermedius]EGQ3973925.1 hypothetical protein [Staphylococcus pseudintermedius]EGQ4229664.1 SDR family oxidoreductase [Staphylococcus pseudintermedius]EHD5243179.1 SDR family oxidoreductase [Staphylococcus pseudintermedius]
MNNILICGGSGTIGSAYIEKYKDHYDNVIIVDKKIRRYNKKRKGLIIIEKDLTVRKDVHYVFEYLNEREINISHLLFTVGVNNMNNFFTETLDDWELTMNVNVKSFFYCMKILYPLFTRRSSVLAISSQNGIVANYNRIDYGPSKSALLQLIKNLTYDISVNKNIDIKINALSPGVILSNQNERLLNSKAFLINRKNHIEQYVKIEELIKTIHFFLDNDIRSFRGANIVMDNGFSL